jgi:glycine betaine transporter
MSTDTDSSPVAAFLEENNPIVFGGSAVVLFGFIALYVVSESLVQQLISDTSSFLYTNLAWFYLLTMLVFVGFAGYLILGPWGNIKLGDEEPEFSYSSYFAMFFSAGIAAGIVFWGPAEAIYHFASPPPLTGAEAETPAAMVGALQYTLFHWGISAWCSYLVIGLPIAYYAYNYDAPMRISTVLAPFVGVDNLDGGLAKLVDILAVFATVGAVGAALGFVGQQILTGLDYAYGISVGGDVGTIVTITGLTVLFTASVASGVRRGVRRISQVNVGLFSLIGLFIFLVGPTFTIVNLGIEALGQYIDQFVAMSLYTNTANDQAWIGPWTVFYWAWWFAAAPLAGLFLARVSRGRTVREVTFTGVIATTMATVPWFVIIGGTSMLFQSSGRADILGPVSEYGVAVSGFPLFQALPLGNVLVAAFLLLVLTFFLTTADSTTLALSMITTGGEEHPSVITRVFWGVTLGLIASILVVIGGTSALQNAAVITGGPLGIIGLVATYGLIKEFSSEYGRMVLQEDESVMVPDTDASAMLDSSEIAEDD